MWHINIYSSNKHKSSSNIYPFIQHNWENADSRYLGCLLLFEKNSPPLLDASWLPWISKLLWLLLRGHEWYRAVYADRILILGMAVPFFWHSWNWLSVALVSIIMQLHCVRFPGLLNQRFQFCHVQLIFHIHVFHFQFSVPACLPVYYVPVHSMHH